MSSSPGRASEAVHLREVVRVEGLQTVGSGLLTLGLVAVAVVLSLYQRLGLEKDIGVAVVRSFLQLAAIGYVIDDIAEQRSKVEAALALGATSRQAVAPILRTALQRALIPLIDATKTTGIIFLPGAMVGMIIAGADPLEAVRLQIVVLYMLLG